MYLKSIELHGFKSFPNRTVMTFDKGATVIVGPNGSGKSNISDAMRWVLGELSSRNLRGAKMEDVIFGGADSKRPMSFAEVSVTFDNSDPEHRIDSPYEEITVTRRYYRKGESEYMINRQSCRLRDIFEMFMNTGVGREGYSIIGQGKIAEIISKKSEDRRNFFEEAAGISKFRHRKRDSENKLAATEANMVREQDIFNELESRIGPLEKEAEKARKYLVVAEEKRRADVSLWLYDTKKIREDIEKYRDESALAEKKLEIITEALEELEQKVTRLEQENFLSRAKSEELVASIEAVTAKLHSLDSRHSLSQNETDHIMSLIAACNDRIMEIGHEMADLEKEKAEIAKRIKSLQKGEADLADQRLGILADQQKLMNEVVSHDRQLEEEQVEISRLEEEAVSARARAEWLKAATEEGGGKYATLKAEIKSHEDVAVSLKADQERCEQATSAYKEKIAECEATMAKNSAKEAELVEEREMLTERCNQALVARDAALERANALKQMEEQLEGYSGGVRFVMDKAEAGQISGKVYGPVSKLIHVETKHAKAVESALGASIQHIVVDKDETAKAAIRALREAQAGKATFLPVETMRPQGETEEIRAAVKLKGYVNRADRLVDCDSKFRSVMESLLLRTLVFDTLDNANAAARALQYRVRIVTLEGDIMNAGGSMTGGASKGDKNSILSRGAVIEQMFKNAEKKDEEVKDLQAQLKDLADELFESKAQFRDAEQSRDLLLTMSRAQFAALDQATAKLEANDDILKRLREDYESLRSTRSRSEVEMGEIAEKLSAFESQIAELKHNREEHAKLRNEIDDRRIALGEEANELQLRRAEMLKDIEAAEAQVASLVARIEGFENDIQLQNQSIEQHKTNLGQQEQLRDLNRGEHEDLQSELDELRNARRLLEEGMTDYSEKMAELRELIKKKTAEKESCFAISTRMGSKLEQLLEEQDRTGTHLYEEYELTYEEAVALDYPEVTKENRAEVAQALTSARNRLRAMGAVNPNAVEEYNDVKQRYDSMKVQLDDLKKSREELLGIISRLESEMRISFLDAFAKINENFGIVFRELFGGGQAELQLTDPEDVLTSGIEIRVAPPGKIIKSLSLLSGGEQAFVAIALFFAIIKVNPTPFCILDEVEAALDEVNVNRFGAYIRKMASETQFILITHRRGTMEIAERLYGVTMPEKGISRVIGINVNEIDSMHKELLDEIN